MRDQAEKLRQLASNRYEANSKFITIASGKGGVGKTNFAMNFAYILANSFSKRVLLIDADIGMANIHLFIKNQNNKTIKDLLAGERIENLITSVYGFDTIFGFSGIEDLFEMEEFAINSIIQQLEKVVSKYDYVIIDAGAGVDEQVSAFVRSSHNTYVLTTPEPTSLMDAYALMKSIANLYGYNHFKIIVNMAKDYKEGLATFQKLENSVKKFLNINLEFLGSLPNSPTLKQAVRKKELIAQKYPKDSYTEALKQIAESETLSKPIDKSGGFWQKLYGLIRKGHR